MHRMQGHKCWRVEAKDDRCSYRPHLLSAARPFLRLIDIRLIILRCRDSIITVLTDLIRFMRDQGFSPT